MGDVITAESGIARKARLTGNRVTGGPVLSDEQVMDLLLLKYIEDIYQPELIAALSNDYNQRYSRMLGNVPVVLRRPEIGRLEYESFLRARQAALTPVFKRLNLAWPIAGRSLLNAIRPHLANWASSHHDWHELHPNSSLGLYQLPSGKVYQGSKEGYKEAVAQERMERMLRTANNIRRGVGGAIGYFVAGDKGSDIGAALDELMSVGARTRGGRVQHQIQNQPPVYRPDAALIAPAPGTKAVGDPSIMNKATGNPLAGPAKPTSLPPSPTPTTPQAPPTAAQAAASQTAGSGGGKPPSGGGGGTPTPAGPPKSTMDKLRQLRIDVNDPYTMAKLNNIYRNNRDPAWPLKNARGDTGELRALVRAGKQAGVRLVRFVEPGNKKDERTPDIEVQLQDGRRSFIEVRTVTEARTWARVQDAPKQRGLSGMFAQSVENKLRHGQISSNNPGTIVFHAPFQTINSTALDGWRTMLGQIITHGSLPAGLNRIEVTGGTNGAMLIFQPPGWQGVVGQ